jgi:hypothetical protein
MKRKSTCLANRCLDEKGCRGVRNFAVSSIMLNGGCSAIKWPPQRRQNLRWLSSVFANVSTFSAPFVIFTEVGCQRLKAFTGPPDHDRHDRQWQYPMAFGSPVTWTSTAPQKHVPL